MSSFEARLHAAANDASPLREYTPVMRIVNTNAPPQVVRDGPIFAKRTSSSHRTLFEESSWINVHDISMTRRIKQTTRINPKDLKVITANNEIFVVREKTTIVRGRLNNKRSLAKMKITLDSCPMYL